jgi:hypothetical protein
MIYMSELRISYNIAGEWVEEPGVLWREYELGTHGCCMGFHRRG